MCLSAKPPKYSGTAYCTPRPTRCTEWEESVTFYRVDHTKRIQFSALENTGTNVVKPRQNCCSNWIEHSRRHGEILDEEGTLLRLIYQKVTFSPEGLYHSSSRFSKRLMVNVGVSWSGKTDVFFIDPLKKSWPELLHWSVKDFLTAWMSLGNDFQFLQDSVPSHRAKVTQQFLWQNTPDCRTSKRQSKTNGRKSPLRQFENHWINDWMRLESRMEARVNTFSANHYDWISTSCRETC